MRIELGFGLGVLELEAGEDVEVVQPKELSAADPDEIERSLDRPLGRGLDEFQGCKSASILVSDITRPAPTHLMLPPLVRRLKRLGVVDLNVVFGLGTHRRMTPEEERQLLKDCVSLPYIQHNPKACVPLGETKRGTPVEIFETVASSDLIVATGNIEYHYYAGYSGGAKAVLPGVSSERSVIKNHELMRDPCAITGRPDSPVRQDMEEAAEIADLDFILNVVLNSRKEIVQSICRFRRQPVQLTSDLIAESSASFICEF